MRSKKILLLLLCSVLAVTAVFPTALSAKASAAGNSYDYSRDGSYFNTNVSSKVIFDLFGIEISDAESAYLDAHGTLSVKYEAVTTQQISVSTLDGDTIVTARPYTYTAVNGQTVTWNAISATVGAQTRDFIGTTANFGSLPLDDDATVCVTYSMTPIDILASDFNNMLNLAYTDALSLKAEMDSYNANMTEIEAYLDALAVYEQYLSDDLVYRQKLENYNNYKNVELPAYETALKNYNEYKEVLDYYNYVKDTNEANTSKYESDLVRYNKYLADLELVKTHIAILDNGLMTKVETENYKGDKARQLYGCLFANLVDEVVLQKDKLTKIGAKQEDIDACAVASDNIRAILKPADSAHYVSLKTTEDKYAFYVNNYEALRDNILILTRSLYSIYSKPGVKAAMHIASDTLGREDYTERLAIFIAQLIYFSNALSDEPVMSKDGKTVLNGDTVLSYRDINGTDVEDITIHNILLQNVFVTDNGNAAPITIIEVPEPTPPILLPEIDPPAEVAKPIEPEVVLHPGDAPEVVAEPIDKYPSSCFVSGLSKQEILSKLEILEDGISLNLVNALDNSLLDGGRVAATENKTYTPTLTLEKKIRPADMVEVTFTDTDGSVITTVGVDRGTAVNFTEALPTKPEDISATYAFSAWVNDDGIAYDLSAVSESVTLYPSFTPTYKEYNIGGEGTSKYLDVDISGKDETLESIPIAHFIDIAKKNLSAIRLTDGDVNVSIPYTSVLELEKNAADSLSVSLDTSIAGLYTFEISAYTALGNVTASVSGISVSIPCSDEIFAKNSLLAYTDAQGSSVSVGKSYSSGLISFRAVTCVPYTLTLKYSISASTNLGGRVSAPADAAPGETVTLVIDVPAGTKAELYYTLLSDYSKHVIEGNSFVMPYGNITLGGRFTELEYTVKFVSDGKVLSTNIYKYGDTVKIPKNPTKLNDGEYSYTFTGWSPEITAVTCDVTYEAQFDRTLLPEVKKEISWFNVLFYSAVSVFSLGAVTLILFILDKKKVISIKGILRVIGQKIAWLWDRIIHKKTDGTHNIECADKTGGKNEDNHGKSES